MVVLSRKTSFFLSLICLLLLFLPKINVITFKGRETAGIRIDDIILFSVTYVIFWAHLSLRVTLSALEKCMFAIVAFSLFSYLTNRLFVTTGFLHVNANILYALRIFEYFIFFYIGTYAARHFNYDKIIWLLFIINFFFMLLQKLGWVGSFSSSGYSGIDTYRCRGLCAFPSEMGLILNMFFCYFLTKTDTYCKKMESFFREYVYNPQLFPIVYLIILMALFAFLIAINGSRIALVAQAFVFLVFLANRYSTRTALVLAITISLIGGIVLSQKGTSLSVTTERMSNLFRIENIKIIKDVWAAIDIQKDPTDNHVIFYDDAAQDRSWWLRLHKWAYAIKIYLMHPVSYFQGIGPGFATAALDGGIVRILVENGIIGVVLFGILFWLIASESFMLQLTVIVLLINMIFFDAHLAYKPMSLLFLLAGFARKSKHIVNVYAPST